jgi:ubiquinone/menaquinone biosynthesis C-methylase UbiE
MSHPTYVLGSSPRELSRLSQQSQIIQPTTERLLQQAGIREGLRVLDLGCGAGDVSMLAAEMVGPSGSVVGIDRSAEAIANAEARVRDNGFLQINLHVSSVEEFSSDEPFDVVVGRYVLIHQVVPSDFVRTARRHVCVGGVLAFHEIICHRAIYSLPVSPLFERMAQLWKIGCSAFMSNDAAGRLVEHFQKADLPPPELFAEIPVGGGADSPFYAWTSETIRALMPILVKRGAATEEEISIDTLEERLRLEAVAMQSQIAGPVQVCAWTRL